MLLKLIVCALALFFVGCSASSDDTPPYPVIADQYYVEALYKIPYFNTTQPIKMIFDSPNNRQYWDYYDGMDRFIYQFDHAYSYQIVPHLNDPEWCQAFHSKDLAPLVNIFPVVDDTWEYNGQTYVHGIPVHDWVLHTDNFNKTGVYHFFVSTDFHTPVQLWMDGVNFIFDSHPDIYVIDYLTYIPDYVNKTYFDIPAICDNAAPMTSEKHEISEIRRKETTSWLLNAFSNFGALKQEIEEGFQSFAEKFQKRYESEEEAMKRKIIFAQNLHYIKQFNLLGRHTLGMNHFGDLTHDEFKDRVLMKNKNRPLALTLFDPLADVGEDALPVWIDWRQKGAVTPVKDQGSCGSCWTFGSTGSLEGVNFLSTGILVSLSEQQILDCAWTNATNQGCNGGFAAPAYQWIIDNDGIATERSYPYLAEDGYCRSSDRDSDVVVKNYVNVTAFNETALKVAVGLVGPVAIAIDASVPSFRFYMSGVYYAPECQSGLDALDHEVLAIGYGQTSDGTEFWLVKNSWSPHWGSDGFIQMSRNRGNNCGVASQATYPIV